MAGRHTFLVRLGVLALVAAASACSSPAPPADSAPGTADGAALLAPPLPKPTPSGLGITLSEFVTMPPSKPTPPVETGDNLDRWNRINYLGEIPDGSGRLFVPDLNGTLYVIDKGVPRPYLNVAGMVGPSFWNHAGIGTGFGFVAFHPEFTPNGKFYTVHTEARGALTTKKPNLPTGGDKVDIHGVITEWTTSDPAASRFTGTRREVLRIGFFDVIHGIQQIGFNPTARPGDEDYGLLYLAVGDGGTAGDATESLKTTVPVDVAQPQGKLLRIDPAGRNGSGGQYGIPASNPFVARSGVLPEIYASGLRGPYRFSWDSAGEHRMFLGNIGNEHVESIYEVKPGDNYGWSEREGPFTVRLGDGPDSCDVSAVPAAERDKYVFPVAAYGHNDPPSPPGFEKCEDNGYAVIAGFVYHGQALPDLRGKYVFGDGVTGRIFHTDPADMRRGNDHLATIGELTLFDQTGRQITLQQVSGDDDVELAGQRKVDLRFGTDARGELYVLSKANGKIWRVTASRSNAPAPTRATR